MSEIMESAHELAEAALRAQAEGRDGEAELLFAEAQTLDPDAVAAVLRRHDAAHEPDARDSGTFRRDRVMQHARA